MPASFDTPEGAADEEVLNNVLFQKATENCPGANIFGNGVERRHLWFPSLFSCIHSLVSSIVGPTVHLSVYLSASTTHSPENKCL
jgi:hypothetical protein